MDFKDYFKQLSERVGNLKEQIQTEEATKNAFIMPFIQMLGYDVFNPTEVIPELDCDLIRKKGDKIDYAICKDGEPVILIECKHWKQDLNLHDVQLQKYFVASRAKFGLLTNGIKYRFYTDLVRPNIMDDVPFLVIDMENYTEAQVEELKKFHKSYFNVEDVLNSASELKYMSELKNTIKDEFASPSTELVKLLTKRVYDGTITKNVIEQFTPLVKRSLASHINDVISERLNIAMQSTEKQPDKTAQDDIAALPEAEDDNPKIVTTEEELEGFYIVKSILRDVIPAERITYRDAQSYFAIFADDNNRKPICRLYFNTSVKKIGIFDVEKKETKYELDSLDDIYTHREALRESVTKYV